MNWKTAMKQKVLRDRAKADFQRYLLSIVPPFHAPTDPAAWRRKARQLRRQALAQVYLRGYSRAVIDARPRVIWGEVLKPDAPYVIRKLRYEIYPDYWIPALLYEPLRLRGKVPVVFNPNGHHAGGKAVDYKQIRCANIARRGLLALSPEFIGMGELQADVPHDNQAHLNLTGMAGVGLFYLTLKKGLDVLLAHPRADRRRVCCTGLSGGGWQTIVLSALDPRVTAVVPVAGYTAMRTRVLHAEDLGDMEQMPPDLTTVLDYQDMTAMLAPRPLLQIMNVKDDCCFRTDRTKPVIVDAIRPTYRAFGAADKLTWHSNEDPGTHNYGADNRAQFYTFINRHFGLNAPERDIHGPDEIYPESELEVGLPDNQQTMLTLALARERRLARRRRTPRTAAERRALRERLAEVIRLPRVAARVRKIAGDRRGAALHLMRVGPWQVPIAARVWPGGSAELVIEDWGRAGHADPPPARGQSVFIAEITGTGENAVPPRLLQAAEAAGVRALGIQVAQILACAQWARRQAGVRKLQLRGHGAFSAFAALLAAALQPNLFKQLSVTWEIMRLRYLMQWPRTYESALPLFCFGLLEVADVPELLALLEGVEFKAIGRQTIGESCGCGPCG
jgi:dienelactone hydrolase